MEDSPTGVQAAVAAGMTCYAVPDATHHHPAEFESLTPYIFADLYGVLNAIKQMEPIDYQIAAG